MKYSKSEAGQRAFKERSPLISARQRSAFIMFDGEKSVEKVLGATHGLGVTQADVDHLVAQGFLIATAETAVQRIKDSEIDIDLDIEIEPAGLSDDQARYVLAKPLATQLTASLGLRGFRLNLAVEAASGYDELLKLLPKIQEALGPKACRELEQVLKG